jgi:hypothetical protein
MRNLFILIWLLVSSHWAFSQNTKNDCNNGSLEEGTFNHWSNYTDSFGGGNVNLNSLNAGTIAGRHTLVTSGLDPELSAQGVSMPMVVNGTYAYRLGNSTTGSQFDHTRYTFTVDDSNKDFSFRYAVVLEDPSGHSKDQKPFFEYRIIKGTSTSFWNLWLNTIEKEKWVADSSDPYFEVVSGGIVYRDWSTKCIDLSEYVGDTVTILFSTADCSQGGHYGYAYIDGMCSNGNGANASFTVANEFCPDNPLIADGSASINEDSHFWSVQESLPNWTGVGTEYTQWFVADEAGTIDLKSFIEGKGGTFKCNTYYRVKLAVSNECVPWDSETKLIYASCPEVNAGKDICCKGAGFKHVIGSTSNNDDYTYSWSPSIGLYNPTNEYTGVNCSVLQSMGLTHMTYTLTATDESGCQGTDTVTVYLGPPTGAIVQNGDCCSKNLKFNGTNYTHLEWSTGEENVDEIIVDMPGTYWVTAYNPCGGKSFPIVVEDGFERYYANLNDENVHSYYSSTSNVNSFNTFNIWHVEDPQPPYGEYFATEYKLEIYNRWGELIRTITEQIPSCQGFDNPAIHWDGTVGGSNVQSGIYNGKLYLKNCQFNTNWKEVKVNYCEEWGGFTCLDWDCKFFLFSFECGFFKKNICMEWQNPQCIDERKELVFPIHIEF